MTKARLPDKRNAHWTEEDAREVLDEWRRSGDSLAVFARKKGLVPKRLYWWKKRLPVRQAPSPGALTLVPARVVTETAAVVLRLPSGIALEISNASPSWVVAVAAELARSLP